jgi:2-dehydropantoate 2-reductase
VVEHPAGGYDLIAVFVRAHQVDAVLASLAGVEGDVLFALNWAAGPGPLGAVIGPERVLLGFPTDAGTMDGDVVRYRSASFLTRRVPMPVGEPGGRATPRLERIVRELRTAGINAKAEPQMDAWLKTHAAFAVPLGQAVLAAGGPAALADDPDAVRAMIRLIRQNLAALPTPPVPRGFAALRTLPEGLLVAMLRRFLRSPTAAHSGLSNATPAAEAAELEQTAEQMRAYARVR